MKIESIEIVRVAMPLISPFTTAYGSDDTIESVLVKLTSGETHGWGESCPLKAPTYSPECAAAQFVVSREFVAPLLLGQDISAGQELQQRLSPLKGNYFAKGGFDMAWWDLHAKRRGLPLWKALGGTGPTIETGADFGVMDSLDDLIEAIQKANERGHKRVKLKYKPGWGLNMVQAVRNEFPDTTFHIDCNSAYTLADLDMFKALDEYNLAMIEQPLSHDDLIDHATLQAAIRTPICLDESITSVQKTRKAIQVKACGWVNIKPGRVGGTTNALAINKLCQEAGIPCWIGGMLESAVGAAHCLALATLPNIKYPCDIFPSDRFYRRDLGTPPTLHSGPAQFTAHDKPGIGVEPDPDLLEEYLIERAVLEA
jgi:O-succinylbenzoate synthase